MTGWILCHKQPKISPWSLFDPDHNASLLAISLIYRLERFIAFIDNGDTMKVSALAILSSHPCPMNQLLSVPSQVGLVLRAVRKSAKMSQKQLAAKLGLSQNRVSELETDPGSMRVDQLLAVISVLGLELQVQTRGGSPVAGSEGGRGEPTAGKVEW
ncbi:helix-turn-helix domain-containing protein [Curvibacter lanceolatus]|jgi:HTH-type transcriptional regulator/antitoxin HipB|uniref:helix-turn-helix domain-containing protein n=1 Tax=Curvibacter lanceolatus TaxID=86182 RepID=UPI0030811D69